MLKNLFWTFFTVSSIFSIGIAFFLFHVSQADIDYYQKFLQRHHRYLESANMKSYTSYQDRKSVQKDIWMAQEGFRPHLRIISATSHLKCMQNQGKLDLIEELEDLECWMQDKIDSVHNRQSIRHFHAREGSYCFFTNQFFAKKINLDFFEFMGTTLPEQFPSHRSYLMGTAKEFYFSFRNKLPFIRAYELSAEITVEGKL